METKTYTCPKVFLQEVEAFLMNNEVVNSLALGVALNLAKAEYPPKVKPLLAAVYEQGNVRLAMLKTTSHLVLAGGGGKAAASAANYLFEHNIPVPSVIGTRDAADSFAEAWRERNNCQFAEEMSQRMEIGYKPEADSVVYKFN